MTSPPAGAYSFWLGWFYLLVFVLCSSLALCVYVAICFRNGHFPFVWPVRCHPRIKQTPVPQVLRSNI